VGVINIAANRQTFMTLASENERTKLTALETISRSRDIGQKSPL